MADRWVTIRMSLAFAVSLLMAACGGDGGENATPTAGPPTLSPTVAASATPAADCAANLAAAPRSGDVTWEEILPDAIPAPEGWEVRKGEGEGPFLTVLDGDVAVGLVELLQFPLGADFDPEAGAAAFAVFTEEYYDSIEADRKAYYGESYVLEGGEPVAAPFGKFCGIGYGFTGTQDGEVLDEVAAFATYDRSTMYLVVASYDVGLVSEGLAFKTVEALRQYEPSLGELVAALRVPAE